MGKLNLKRLMRHHCVSSQKREEIKVLGEYGEKIAELIVERPMEEFCKLHAIAALKEAVMWATVGIVYDEPLLP